ncbi:hypothetical protein KC573_02105 [candidate division WWE3 bacterium]|uniref:Uncharacterized protein n=1 Tax=candidate division WWE3 bacterium TaxID=2053526 RepID=A0A955LW24_UNCKA|nr:hypothetical protein [candidate division WWE3 bacterium]
MVNNFSEIGTPASLRGVVRENSRNSTITTPPKGSEDLILQKKVDRCGIILNSKKEGNMMCHHLPSI